MVAAWGLNSLDVFVVEVGGAVAVGVDGAGVGEDFVEGDEARRRRSGRGLRGGGGCRGGGARWRGNRRGCLCPRGQEGDGRGGGRRGRGRGCGREIGLAGAGWIGFGPLAPAVDGARPAGVGPAVVVGEAIPVR